MVEVLDATWYQDKLRKAHAAIERVVAAARSRGYGLAEPNVPNRDMPFPCS
jgi:predicted GNAT superfamily acetyltransferase